MVLAHKNTQLYVIEVHFEILKLYIMLEKNFQSRNW